MTEEQKSYYQFKYELSLIHAAERHAAAEEAAIERQLAASWFLSHPEEWERSKPIHRTVR